jgi:hypothetical protein
VSAATDLDAKLAELRASRDRIAADPRRFFGDVESAKRWLRELDRSIATLERARERVVS